MSFRLYYKDFESNIRTFVNYEDFRKDNNLYTCNLYTCNICSNITSNEFYPLNGYDYHGLVSCNLCLSITKNYLYQYENENCIFDLSDKINNMLCPLDTTWIIDICQFPELKWELVKTLNWEPCLQHVLWSTKKRHYENFHNDAIGTTILINNNICINIAFEGKYKVYTRCVNLKELLEYNNIDILSLDLPDNIIQHLNYNREPFKLTFID